MSDDNTNVMIEKVVYIGVFGAFAAIMGFVGYLLFTR